MAIITKNFTLTNGTVAQGSDVNTDFDTIYNDYNGNITNANLSASAGITDDRLSAISTFGKVLGSSLSTLAGISASAGIIPTKNGGLNNDLSGATLGSLAYFSSAGTGNYLASGTSGYILMSTGTTANPTYVSSCFFGVWVDKSGGYAAQQTTTDGFIVLAGASGTGSIEVFTDSNSNPTTRRGHLNSSDQAGIYSITVPVRKNDYWKVVLNGSASLESIYFLPTGH